MTREDLEKATVFADEDFSSADLSGVTVVGRSFTRCNFDSANMSSTTEQKATWDSCSFIACTFRRTKWYRTRFPDTTFAACTVDPVDAYGVTVTLQCKTFENAHISQLWWYLWLMFAATMRPVRQPVVEDLRELLISFIGQHRYLKLQELMARRNF